MDEPQWVEGAIVLQLHQEQLAEFGGMSGIRDADLLDSALCRARNVWAYSSPKPDVVRMAASYAFGLAKNHPFMDGNKRTALVVCLTFLRLNGFELTASQQERIQAVLSLASGAVNEAQFEAWLRSNVAPAPSAQP
jgi:death-on-curing protein